ncbi:MAG: helix-turn-helix transcriptional regulator [Bacteroidales bacterium]|nr:helix-turn-helix transcriptional regulator [Bacteroidales bacterium]
MQEIAFKSVQQFNDHYGIETLHPLVSVARYDREEYRRSDEEAMIDYGVYALFLKENKGCVLNYGLTPYDFDEMTVTSFAPGQKVHVIPNPKVLYPKWTALVFHPDFLSRTSLGRQMSRYGFFSYTSNEALHLSAAEVEIFRSIIGMIGQELHHAIDKHTHELIVSNIELLLNYCLRFYERQFITREEINHSVVKKFERLLNEYLQHKAEAEGVPTVAYFAEQCHLSPAYFGELVKTETDITAQEFIADRMVSTALELLNDDRLSIGNVGERLGFQYPQHFVRFFKRHTGKTPSQYRMA